MELFQIFRPGVISSPIVLSVPHAGFAFPEALAHAFRPDMLPPDDTDWEVDRLYQFATEMGMVLIVSRISRWVIDLNRNPEGQALYNDGRVITALCPATNFMGVPLYRDGRSQVTAAETAARKTAYFEPYHAALQQLLDEVKALFGKVLLWDCHAIRRSVPAIQSQPFPDLILGSADGTTAPADLIDLAAAKLSGDGWNLQQNHPFKGGYITRHYGQPGIRQYALQLEMAKDLYMDDNETHYHEMRASTMQNTLRQTLASLTTCLLQSSN